ncbi:peptidoglycan recognition protein family protein [Nonomuraea wenchangensis]|uniref:peptidoglycan recognition protein family protein n=1 Tax=Nonomuraea wenchangensis TaxID=568860 RepID=UPI003332A6C6
MPYLTQLAKVAKRTGYPVVEVDGWKTRGHGPQPEVQGLVCHHTAGPAGGGDYPSLAVVRSGRPGLDGPLSHFGLGRSGTIYVIAAGRCWHNAPSTSGYHDNSSSIGIEAENNGTQSWPPEQLDAYKRLCAELCREFGLPASRVKGHKEVNTAKPDPHHVDMNAFRRDVAALLKTGEPAALKTSWTEDLMNDLPLLRPGADNYDVKTARHLLRARGYLPETVYSTVGLEAWLDRTKYDDEFADLIKGFQKLRKLDQDSIIGPKTWAALARVA